MSLLTTVDVLLRWLANLPIKGLSDVVSLAVAIVIATSFPIVIAQRQNITIRFLGDVIGPRTALWFDAFGSAALLVFITLVGWQIAVYAGELIESGRTTWQLRLPSGPFWSVAARNRAALHSDYSGRVRCRYHARGRRRTPCPRGRS